MPTVLVTGASRGIGRTTAVRLAQAGWDVIGTVRSAADGEALESAGNGRISALTLDVTDAAQIAALDASLPQQLDAVVNNAGIVVGGPVEGLPVDELRRQFEVNVFGQVAVTQAVLPRLRASKGRIVFVSSVSGRISTPMTGAYNASKFALEALGDALRLEVKPWGIKVSLIEPAQTDTDLWRLAEAAFDDSFATLADDQRDLYAKHMKGFRKTIPISQKLASPADGVAKSIEHALTAKRPRARYVIGAAPKAQAFLMNLTPSVIGDPILSRLTGVPRRA
ncbi:MAG: SDR family oxidoreductase [Solirubrobacteraceae bacterium]|nr:SDR family oxidoreductase [Solirubrobacteraceae bacterium]